MKKKSTYLPVLLLTSILFLKCGPGDQEEDVRVPANLLSEEVFTKVLVDYALAESAANLNIKNVPNDRYDTVYAFDPLKENHVSKSRYDSTLKFYAAHTKLYKKIYENVLAALSEMQTKRDTIRTDSILK